MGCCAAKPPPLRNNNNSEARKPAPIQPPNPKPDVASVPLSPAHQPPVSPLRAPDNRRKSLPAPPDSPLRPPPDSSRRQSTPVNPISPLTFPRASTHDVISISPSPSPNGPGPIWASPVQVGGEVLDEVAPEDIERALDFIDSEHYEEARRMLRGLHRGCGGSSLAVILSLAILRGLGDDAWKHPQDRLPASQLDEVETMLLRRQKRKEAEGGSPAALLGLVEVHTFAQNHTQRDYYRAQAYATKHPLAVYRYMKTKMDVKGVVDESRQVREREEAVHAMVELAQEDSRVAAKAAQQLWVLYYKGDVVEKSLPKAVEMLQKCVRYQIGSSSAETLRKIENSMRPDCQKMRTASTNSLKDGSNSPRRGYSANLQNSMTFGQNSLTQSALQVVAESDIEVRNEKGTFGVSMILSNSMGPSRQQHSPRHDYVDSDEEDAPRAVAPMSARGSPSSGRERMMSRFDKIGNYIRQNASVQDTMTVYSYKSEPVAGHFGRRTSASCTYGSPRRPSAHSDTKSLGGRATISPPQPRRKTLT